MQIQVNILSKQELERVHERSLHLLAKTGVQIETRKGQRILEEAGAELKGNTNHFCFPVDFVEWAIRAAPKKFDLGARRAGWSFPVNEGECTLCMNGEGTSVIDRKSGRMRAAKNKDWLEATRIADYEDDIGIYWRTVTPADRGDSMADFVDYTTTVFRNFSKHVHGPLHVRRSGSMAAGNSANHIR